MRKQQPLNVAVVAEREDENLNKLVQAFTEVGIQTTFIPIGDIVLSVQSGRPSVRYDDVPFDGIDGVLLQVPSQLMLFVEPFLTELTERGVYCQLKPTSFNMLASKPFLYSTLNTHGVQMQKTGLVSDTSLVSSAIDQHEYPVFLEAFHGLDKTQRMIIESKSTLTSFLKSLPFTFDVLAIREFMKGDLYESVVIGTEVFSTKSTWNNEQLQHAKKRISVKLSDDERKTILAATRAIGCDVAVVRMINGNVINVRHLVDMEGFSKALSVDIHSKVAKYYMEKLK